MELCNGIFSPSFKGAHTLESSQTRCFCMIFTFFFLFSKMLFMSRLEIYCFADFLYGFKNQSRVWFSAKFANGRDCEWHEAKYFFVRLIYKNPALGSSEMEF
jgi:hypothetical protein